MSLHDILMQRAAIKAQNDFAPSNFEALAVTAANVASDEIVRRQEEKKKLREEERLAAKRLEAVDNFRTTNAQKIASGQIQEKFSVGPKGGVTTTFDTVIPKEAKKIKPSTTQIEAAKSGLIVDQPGEISSSNEDFALLNQIAEQKQVEASAKGEAAALKAENEEKARIAKGINDINDDIRGTKSVEDYEEIRRANTNIQSAYNRAISADTKSKNAADQTLIISLNKMLDPGSVVRESEYARTPAGESLISQIQGRLKALTAGGSGLTDEGREEILKMSQDLADNAKAFAKGDMEVYRKQAEAFNLPVELLHGGFFEPSVQEFSSVEEAEAANLPVGTMITVNGRKATVQ